MCMKNVLTKLLAVSLLFAAVPSAMASSEAKQREEKITEYSAMAAQFKVHPYLLAGIEYPDMQQAAKLWDFDANNTFVPGEFVVGLRSSGKYESAVVLGQSSSDAKKISVWFIATNAKKSLPAQDIGQFGQKYKGKKIGKPIIGEWAKDAPPSYEDSQE